ncbi:MAG: M28 family peptidase [Gemmatimonadetes bacterium]|nr:M28 family peptidase [Gemmatimonadota bacterium]
MKSPTLRITIVLTSLSVLGCGDTYLAPALRVIDEEGLREHIQTLASDEFEGRAPSSHGEELTIRYLADAFQQMGLQPGNGDSYFQDVPLVETVVPNNPALTIRGRGATTELAFGTEFVGWTKRVVDRARLANSPLVFVGYGVVAPEYDWNDYEGVNVRGSTVVILVNDPGFATQDEALFNGNAMTYYGRWTYKYEEAARQGAAGVIIIHETEPAGYPWEVVESSWTGPQFDLVAEDNNMSRVAVEGWITHDAAHEVFEQAGMDFDELKAQAASREFQAVPMGLRASTSLTNEVTRSTSRNVLAVLRGTDRADEYIVYMAHWDHLGKNAAIEGDGIYNGAFDNATGVAGLLELAQAFASLEQRPARSILFLAVTAEEKGLLGSAYYAANPVYPRNKTVAAINMDGLNTDGPTNDITVIGYGASELDDYLEEAAAAQGRVIRADPEPEKGFYYRSDHFSFAKQGIPALYTDAGIDHVEHGEQWTLARRDEYTAKRYHKPTDEYDPEWDLSGAVNDLRILFDIGFRLSNETTFPNWRVGNEFRARREADMAREGGLEMGEGR